MYIPRGSRPNVRGALKHLKNIMDRESKKKAAKEAAMEAEKVKVQDEKDMLDVQGAKDGGRMGYKDGSMKLAELEKEKSGSDKKIDKFAFVHTERIKKKKKEIGPGSSNPKRAGKKFGGRMGYKNGSMCKLATKGKGRAYGKNS